MSKYQEAKRFINKIVASPQWGRVDIQWEAIDELKELLDKEKPMKPSKDTDDNVRWKYYCPGCGNRLNALTKQRRCQGTDYYVPRYDEFGCGQKIDWSDEDV